VTRLRVLHVVGNLELGGGQKLAALVALALDRERFAVSVLSLGRTSGYGGRLQDSGIEVISLGLDQPIHQNPPRRLLAALAQLLRLLFVRRFDVVHTHMFSSALVVAPLARLSGARVFGTAHRIYYPRIQPALEYLLAFFNDRVVVDSHSVGEILRTRTHIPASRYVVIYNCVDREELDQAPSRQAARAELGLPPDALIVTEIAHLRPHKGQRFLIDAVADVRSGHEELRLLLVGGGPDEAELRRQVSARALEGIVEFLGPRSDLGRLLAASDVLALPSEYEGFGIVQAEAMYLGIPVVATSVGGSTEVVEDGVTGYLVPYGDVPSLAERLTRLLRDPALRRAMGDAGRERVNRHFSPEALAQAYGRLYDPPTEDPGLS